jgi:hypothetical protein
MRSRAAETMAAAEAEWLALSEDYERAMAGTEPG